MATRPLVSYDDITLPYQPTKPPPKKRKRNQQKSVSEEAFADPNDCEEEEESRELTHEEIWDDSALVNAWEAATEEYEAYHGSKKAWKTETVDKAPLWYNIPVESSSKSTSSTPMASVIPAASEGGAENDSQPINFDTFVPTHNPSLDHLSSLAPPMDYAQDTPGDAMVSQDEAFSRALNAMYWGGYWTAMYHCQRNLSKTNIPSVEDDQTDENDKEHHSGEEEDEDFITTQR